MKHFPKVIILKHLSLCLSPRLETSWADRMSQLHSVQRLPSEFRSRLRQRPEYFQSLELSPYVILHMEDVSYQRPGSHGTRRQFAVILVSSMTEEEITAC
ncbi:hypothetical protein RRG08_064901 [Elysia crispata]|uniref:Uncharacterized protein n=1 Tax=Elysia crispata TaxID=231223 RepID=A0AAE0ZSY3_9GAST|nr:hypothetical protein RRG08_064901 [Elysia crispata]